jgi:hypothetical protein
MLRNPTLVFTLLLLAFITGYFMRGSVDPTTKVQEKGGDAIFSSLDPRATQSPVVAEERNSRGKHREGAEPKFSLTIRQLDAVLNMGMTDPVTVFQEMGLSAAQVRLLQSTNLSSKMRDGINALEIRHAQLHEDQSGQYLEISPFPVERLKWIEEIENEVRDIVDNESTPILSRALLARSDLLNRGIFRQVIRLSRDSDGEIQKREYTYLADGSISREDVGRVYPEDLNRWGNLLRLPEHVAPSDGEKPPN